MLQRMDSERSVSPLCRQELVGIDQPVPLLDGRFVPYVNLDNAASTPALRAVVETIDEFLPFYSGVHRGTGYKSRLSTRASSGLVRSSASSWAPIRDARGRLRQERDRGGQQGRSLVGDRLRFGRAHDRVGAPFERPAVASAGPHRARGCAPDGAFDSTTRSLPRRTRRSHSPSSRCRAHRTSAVSCRPSTTWPRGSTPSVAGSWSTPPSSQRIAPSTCARMTTPGTSTSSRSGAQDVRAVRHRRAGRTESRVRLNPDHTGGGTVTLSPSTGGVGRPPDREEAGSPNVLGAIAMAAAARGAHGVGLDRIAAHEHDLTRYAIHRLSECRLTCTDRRARIEPQARRHPVHRRRRRPWSGRGHPGLRARCRPAQRMLLRPPVCRLAARPRRIRRRRLDRSGSATATSAGHPEWSA